MYIYLFKTKFSRVTTTEQILFVLCSVVTAVAEVSSAPLDVPEQCEINLNRAKIKNTTRKYRMTDPITLSRCRSELRGLKGLSLGEIRIDR